MTTTMPTVNVGRLYDLARWLTQEERARREGRPSHWNQGVWVQTSEEGGPADQVVEVRQQGDQLLIKGWSCGTAACAAGHVSLEDGGFPAFAYGGEIHAEAPGPEHVTWGDGPDDLLDFVLEHVSGSYMTFPGGRVEEIEVHAREALGLDGHQASRLFDSNNEWDDMMRLIAEFTGTRQDVLIGICGGANLPPNPDEDESNESWCEGCQEYHD